MAALGFEPARFHSELGQRLSQLPSGIRVEVPLAERSERLREAIESLKERLAKDNADAAASKTDQAKEHAANSETGMRMPSEMYSLITVDGDEQRWRIPSGQRTGGGLAPSLADRRR